jgi:nucleotide-binding universal stress UspA family protein
MEKITKILVPIDFSACSENALVFALQLADKIKANLRLVTVLNIEGADIENTAYALDVIEERKVHSKKRMIKFIEKTIERVRASLDEIPTTQISIEIGNVEARICDVATRNQADYIVMGTQGENSTLDKYLGSVASNVLKNAPCPVMVIPEDAELEENMQLGYATDFLDADPFEIWKAVKLFQPFQPKVKCVHFNEKQIYNEDKIKELETYFTETASELNVEFFSLPAEDKVKDMNDFVENENINMLVMYKPHRSFFESIFHKSYTQKMAKHTNVPLMVLIE